ncbi:hypothetical protein ETC02_17585 [Geobacillus sp. DSP4a]|nr:hypothetical protein [Geobacillus sp. DSP4a]
MVWFGLVTFTIQENSHFLYPLFSLCIPILKSQVQLVVKSLKYISNLIRFFSIDFDKKIRKLNQRFLLTLDQPLAEDNNVSMKDLLMDTNTSINVFEQRLFSAK